MLSGTAAWGQQLFNTGNPEIPERIGDKNRWQATGQTAKAETFRITGSIKPGRNRICVSTLKENSDKQRTHMTLIKSEPRVKIYLNHEFQAFYSSRPN